MSPAPRPAAGSRPYGCGRCGAQAGEALRFVDGCARAINSHATFGRLTVGYCSGGSGGFAFQFAEVEKRRVRLAHGVPLVGKRIVGEDRVGELDADQDAGVRFAVEGAARGLDVARVVRSQG